MLSFKMKACVFLVLFFLATSAQAHHTATHGGGTGFTLFNPFSTESRPPKTFLALDFSADALDDHLGMVVKYQLSGEYAIHPKVSLGLRIPLATLREEFLPKQTSIGDVALTFKTLLWRSSEPAMSLTFGEVTSFPTGNSNDGFGTGVVVFAPYLNWAVRWHKKIDTFLTLGSSVSASHEAAPTVDFATGISVPLVGGKAPLKGLLSLQGSTNLSNDSFSTGSTKAFLTPALIWQMSPKFSTTWGFRVSVIDTLDLKPGVILSPISPLLLTDVKMGFVFNSTYAF